MRPINYPPARRAGRGLFKAANGADVLVINAMGLIFMPGARRPVPRDRAEIEACGLKHGADAILVDFHAEATSEKQALGHFVDGRASCVVGTHTHAPTADERVLPGGTAYMCDVGMCGDYESVLGMDMDEPINRFLTKIPRARFEPAIGRGDAVRPGSRNRRRDGACEAHNSIAARWCFDTYRAAILGRVRRDLALSVSCCCSVGRCYFLADFVHG